MKSILKKIAGTLLALLLLFAALLGWAVWSGNYHMVLHGELYRSGQLSAAQLERHIRHDHIRSIINLRGASPGSRWYRQELAVARDEGVAHADVDMSSDVPLTEAQMKSLVALMTRLPKPLLLHCLGGADRTSLAAALYLYAIKGEPAARAAGQLGMRYGHFPYLFRAGVAAMDDSFRRYVSAAPDRR